MNDSYRGLFERARDAIDALLRASGSDTGMSLRRELAALNVQLEQDDLLLQSETKETAAVEVQDDISERLQWSEENWGGLTLPERAHRVLNAIGDQRRSITDVLGVLNADKPGVSRPLLYNDVASMFKKLAESGELIKVQVRSERNQPRYVYRRPEMSADLVDLENALHASGEVA